MQSGIHETHSMPSEKLPFIFHRDHIRHNKTEHVCLANWHRNLEILYFISGSGTVLCDTRSTEVKAGDLFVVNANSMHDIITETEMCYYCLIVDGDFCTSNDIDTDTLVFENLVSDKAAVALFENIAQNYAHRHKFYNASIRSAVLALLVHLCINHLDGDAYARRRTAGKAVENIKKALGYIQANYTHPITMEEVAAEVGLSRFHFSREFKKATGVTFTAHVNHLRCVHAKKLLADGTHSVTAAATASGFETLSYFTKTFKSHFGNPPVFFLRQE